MAFSFTAQNYSPVRLGRYITRLPLATRIVLGVCIAAWLLGFLSPWDVVAWGALAPESMNLNSMYRLNTYPFIHAHFIQGVLNLLVLTPLLERYEVENGTLTTLAIFTGPFSTFPAGLYLLVEKFLLRANNAMTGASSWVLILVGAEAVKTYKANPHFNLGPYKIPTWSTPLLLTLLITFIVPETNLLGHVCSLLVGYAYGLGYLKYLTPPEKALRWIEGKLNLLGRLPHYVSMDQKTYGRYGVLPTTSKADAGPSIGLVGSAQRLGP